MIKKVLFIVALSIFIFSYVKAEETRTPTFSFNQPNEWSTVVREQDKIKILKIYSDGSMATILFASAIYRDSVGRTAREMIPTTMEMVKQVNRLFTRYIEDNKLPDLPPIGKVKEVDTSRAKVGNLVCVMSSMVLVPLNANDIPIGFMSLTSLENGHRYTISITAKGVSIDSIAKLLEDALKIVESYKTFQNGMIPI